MKTARFTEVVSQCGRPEAHLLLTKDDPAFRKAVADKRIMSIPGEGRASKTDYGLVGYEEKQRAQLLLFPKSLKKYQAMKIVGIKYDLLSGQEKEKRQPEVPAKAKAPGESPKREKAAHSTPKPKEKKAPAKVIEFPKPAAVENHNPEDGLRKLGASVGAALKALEKGNSVAAYNVLKKAQDSIE